MNVSFNDRLRLLRDRSFALFLLHGLLTVFGGAMCYITLTWYVLTLGGGLSSVIWTSVAFWLPQVLLAPLCGVITDRYSRKNILILCNVIRVVSFFSFGLLLIIHPSLTLCYLLNLINGLVFTLLSPAVMAFVRELVENEDLLVANTTCDMNYEIANVAGMGLAGVLVVWFGAPYCLMLVSVMVLIGLFFLFAIQKNSYKQQHSRENSNYFQDFKAGLAYLRARPNLTLLYILNTLLVIQFMVSPILLAPFVKDVLHGGSLAFSLIEVALSAAIILGSLCMPSLTKKLGWYGVIFCGFALMSVAYLVFSFNRSLPIAILLYFIIGFCLPMWALFVSRGQELTPKNMQGRLQASFNSISSTAILGIYVLLSLLDHQMALPHIYWLCSLIGVVAMGLTYIMYSLDSGTTLSKQRQMLED